MFDELHDLYQEVILDHSKKPRNFRLLEGANRVAHGHNPLCGDNITLYLTLEGEVIRDITFQGSGCAISKASASLLTESLKGKSRDEVRQLFHAIHQMVTTGEKAGSELGKLAVFGGVYKFPARVKCAILPWHAVLSAIEGKVDPVSTE